MPAIQVLVDLANREIGKLRDRERALEQQLAKTRQRRKNAERQLDRVLVGRIQIRKAGP